jgi:serine/threonine protein kinase
MDGKTEISCQAHDEFVPRPVPSSPNYFIRGAVPRDQPGRGWFVVKFVRDPAIAQTQIKFNFSILGHRNVAVLAPFCPAAESLGVSMEPYTRSDLSTALAKVNFWEADIWRVSFDILVGIRSIHRRSCLHRDIRPETILLTRDDKVYLGDFATSTPVPGWSSLKGPLQQPVGTPRYMAPELYQVPPTIDRTIDMWAFGVVLFDMASRRKWPSRSPQSLDDVYEWSTEMITEVSQFRVSAELKAVITSLLRPFPLRRPTAVKLLRHKCYQRELAARRLREDWFSDSGSDSDSDGADDHDHGENNDDDDETAE